MMKVREVIDIALWKSGSGYSYNSTISNNIIEIPVDSVDHISDWFSWDWWEREEVKDGEDFEITVKYYHADEDDDEPIATFTAWQNEIIQD